MLHFRNNIRRLICFLPLCAIFASCSIIDLRSIGYSVEPDGFESVLVAKDTPVIIKFDSKMVKNEAEGIVQVTSDIGTVKGDFSWQGNSLFFTPVSGWTAGIRYSLILNGTIRSEDGRELHIQHFVPFYAINKNPPPLLGYFSPYDGESIGTNDFVLELHFTDKMDRLSVESALSIEGIGDKTFEWSNEDRVIKIKSKRSLLPWISCRWTLKESAKNTSGVPIPKQYSGTFTTNLDQAIPFVKRVYPVAYSNGNWNDTGADIKTGLASGQSIAVEFNKPMGETVLRSFSFEPSLTGRADMLSENTVIFIFTRDPEPQTEYTMIISQEAKDTEGLKIGNEFRISFLPEIPYFNVLSINNGNRNDIDITDSGMVLPVRIEQGTGKYMFIIRFSQPLNIYEKQTATQRITLTSYFPASLPAPVLEYVNWSSEYAVLMRWEGLKEDKAIKNYYKLTIPGGRGGISAGGLYMKENIDIFLEVANEN